MPAIKLPTPEDPETNISSASDLIGKFYDKIKDARATTIKPHISMYL